MTGSDSRSTRAAAPLTGAAAPCWVNLVARDLEASQRFYGEVLGWTFRPGKLGREFSVARRGEVPVAGIGAVSSAYQVAVNWMPYFAVENADVAAGRVRERSGTVAVGPLALGRGRGVLAADRDGASFGLWERVEPATTPPASDDRAHAWLRLRTRDAFDAAIFYGEVLDWASGRPGCCEVAYERDEVIVRCGGRPLARISSGAVEAAADPVARPHWQVQFPVDDVDGTVEAVRRAGGTFAALDEVLGGREAVVRDPDGALFTVTDVRTPEGSGD
ncbi:VOC family protein [uncultured Streptomyces sp.]|uniref:VOC family protein n=1 Tax=uncultured Streptomyces sp. TaxID=174707 RepID=UPI00261B1022|nr:VOC family protein [uncultured Streptomyces sp.]